MLPQLTANLHHEHGCAQYVTRTVSCDANAIHINRLQRSKRGGWAGCVDSESQSHASQPGRASACHAFQATTAALCPLAALQRQPRCAASCLVEVDDLGALNGRLQVLLAVQTLAWRDSRAGGGAAGGAACKPAELRLQAP